MTTVDETVHTWADGHGIWSARVNFEAGGYGPAYLDRNASRIRAKARRAIRREVLARQAGPVAPIRLEVAATALDHMNVMHSITYREKA